MSEYLIAFDDLRADYVRSGFNGSFSGWLSTEITRLRALNAELVAACKAFVEEHRSTKWCDPPKPPCECLCCKGAYAALDKVRAANRAGDQPSV